MMGLMPRITLRIHEGLNVDPGGGAPGTMVEWSAQIAAATHAARNIARVPP